MPAARSCSFKCSESYAKSCASGCARTYFIYSLMYFSIYFEELNFFITQNLPLFCMKSTRLTRWKRGIYIVYQEPRVLLEKMFKELFLQIVVFRCSSAVLVSRKNIDSFWARISVFLSEAVVNASNRLCFSSGRITLARNLHSTFRGSTLLFCFVPKLLYSSLWGTEREWG